MKLWLSKNSEIPIKDQLVAQVRVAAAAGDLKPGDRLPSTRDIARRFAVHPNTVSAAYRELARAKEVVMRSGSGVFVAEPSAGGDVLERLIDSLFSGAEALGYSQTHIMERIESRLGSNRHAGFALFEPNPDLAEILAYEISEATGSLVSIVEAEDLVEAVDSGLRLIALPDEKPRVTNFVPDASRCTFLSVNSVALSMVGQARPTSEDIVAVVSGWDDFRNFARLFLIAAKVDPDSIVIISTAESAWKSKLRAVSMIICDSVVGSKLRMMLG